MLLNSAWIVGGTTFLALPLSVVFATIAFRTDCPFRVPLTVLIAATFLIPLCVTVTAWDAGFGQQGWFSWNGDSSIQSEPLLGGWRSAIWIHAVSVTPCCVLIVGFGLCTVPPELEDTVRLDGASWQVFQRVTLPHAWPAIAISAMWIAVNTAGEITVTDIFGVRTYAEELFVGFAVDEGSGLVESTLNLLPGITLSVALAACFMVVSSFWAPLARSTALRSPSPYLLGGWRLPALLVMLATSLTVVAVPLVNLAAKGGIRVEPSLQGFSRTWEMRTLTRAVLSAPWEYREEFIWSGALGILVALCSILLGVPLAWLLVRGSRLGLLVVSLLVLCLVIPGPVLGLLVVRLRGILDWPPWLNLFDRTLVPTTVALTMRTLPLSCLVLWFGFRTIAQATWERAILDGARGWHVLLRVIVPQRPTAVLVAFIVSLAWSMGELPVTFLTVPPGLSLLSVRVFNLAHYAQRDLPGVSICCFVLFGAITMLALAIVAASSEFRSSRSL